MPSSAQDRWRDGFNSRHRFGIPLPDVLPSPNPTKGGAVMPSIVALPTRSGSLRFPDSEVSEVISLFSQVESGQAIKLTEKSDDKESTARNRAQTMKEQILSRKDSVPAGMKIRCHVLTEGDPTEQKIGTKKYKVYPVNWAAISLAPAKDSDSEDTSSDTSGSDTPPDTPPADTGATGDTDNADNSGENSEEDKSEDTAAATRRRR